MAYFDDKAAGWDTSPRLAMARAVAEAILARIPIPDGASIVDIGAGTGSLSLLLAERADRIVAIDSSEGMLAQLSSKSDPDRIRTIVWDIESGAPDGLAGTADYVVSMMALHHIRDTVRFAGTCREICKPDGRIAIADLDSEDGNFHEDPSRAGVRHNGFDRDSLSGIFSSAGFTALEFRTVHTMERGSRTYPLFLMTGRRA
jgi:SAM-dependent methyltransferase